MAFDSGKKEVKLVVKNIPAYTIIYVTDIGPVEGLDEYIGFWREGDDIPFHIVSKGELVSITLEDHKIYVEKLDDKS